MELGAVGRCHALRRSRRIGSEPPCAKDVAGPGVFFLQAKLDLRGSRARGGMAVLMQDQGAIVETSETSEGARGALWRETDDGVGESRQTRKTSSASGSSVKEKKGGKSQEDVDGSGGSGGWAGKRERFVGVP